ncbi:hypothetical protein D3C80_2061600 [compost metagenome]
MKDHVDRQPIQILNHPWYKKSPMRSRPDRIPKLYLVQHSSTSCSFHQLAEDLLVLNVLP